MKTYSKWFVMSWASGSGLPEAEEEGRCYHYRAPYNSIDLIHDLLAASSGRVIAEEAVLLHPSLGAPLHNRIGNFTEGQLDWLAEKWAELCSQREKAFGDTNDVAPLLVVAGSWAFVIGEEGKVSKARI